MTEQSSAHETIAWAKQRLDEVDAMVAQTEKAAGELQQAARGNADLALSRLRDSQAKLKEQVALLQAQADETKGAVLMAQKAVEEEWVEVESAFQAFLASAGEQSDVVRKAISARVEAQRKSFERALNGLKAQAETAVEKASIEFDTAMTRLSEEAEKAKVKLGQAPSAGEETWEAIKAGIAETKAVHEKTVKKITEALAKLF
ncbi:conserved hypothetical protein (plasmid) [Xanthobacter versatilis]|uniref:Uncharacterized protein n=1 Tax=Xanthobacter autotrophicus (strain ATCC BAA-1158 / Py2) TaxID=78245 RepID=A7IQ31_XANP2|nr:conserved hypothetical protein [Xanthobacter autotrophicus Py2]